MASKLCNMAFVQTQNNPSVRVMKLKLVYPLEVKIVDWRDVIHWPDPFWGLSGGFGFCFFLDEFFGMGFQ
jgi:hypothetical protein